MKKFNPNKDSSISLRTIHIIMIIGAIIISGVLFYSTYHMSVSFKDLANTSEKQIELRKAARELMDASDYLTEKVQRFSVEGDMRFVDEYFEEAFEANRREEAIATMSKDGENNAALEKLQNAMNASLKLMNREYYAMKLVIEAKGYTKYPEILRSVELSDKDQSLSSEDKMIRAARMVHDDVYYKQKDEIRGNMQDSLDELEQMAYDTDDSALDSLHDEMFFVRLVIALQIIAIFVMIWLTSRLGIHPILNAVDRIREDRPIPEVGADEFRYLARTYNRMYDVYKSSLEHLNFKASHDELTGAYNRSGYELLMSSIDLSSAYMLLFDIDNFKGINDEFGHETGDKVLIKLVQSLKQHFRSDDYVCRVGGDEFVVIMIHSAEAQHELIAQKIAEINQQLAATDDGLPPTSISVGIAHGKDVNDAEDLFDKADTAMYQSKHHGKHTYTFFAADTE